MDTTDRRTVLAVRCTASFLAVVDTTIVTIALPSIRSEFRLSLTGAQWVLTAYAVAFGGPGSRGVRGDGRAAVRLRTGRRRRAHACLRSTALGLLALRPLREPVRAPVREPS